MKQLRWLLLPFFLSIPLLVPAKNPVGTAAFDKAVDKLFAEGYPQGLVTYFCSLGTNPDLGFRWAGTSAERAVGDRVAAEMRAMGLSNVRLEPVPVDVFEFEKASVAVGDRLDDRVDHRGRSADAGGRHHRARRLRQGRHGGRLRCGRRRRREARPRRREDELVVVLLAGLRGGAPEGAPASSAPIRRKTRSISRSTTGPWAVSTANTTSTPRRGSISRGATATGSSPGSRPGP